MELETEGNLMRKFLCVVAVGALVLAMAAPAMALDFKFGSEYRIRFYSGDNVDNATPAKTFDHNNPNRNYRGAQIRVRPRFDVSDDNGNITATWRAEIGDIEFGNGGGANSCVNCTNISNGGSRVGNGAGGGFDTDGVNVETKWVYVDAQFPFNIPLRIRAGLQPWYLPKGMIVDQDAAGVRAYGTSNKLSYEVAWYRVNSGTATSSCPASSTGQACQTLSDGGSGTGQQRQDNNYDFWQFKVDSAHSPLFNPGVYFLYALNKATTVNNSEPAQTYYFGFTATGKSGNVSYDLDFIYGSAEGGNAGTLTKENGKFMKVKGFAVDGGVHVPVGPLTVSLLGSYATGDKQNGGDSEAFPTIAGAWNGAGGQYEIIGNGATFDAIDTTQDTPTNLWMLGATVEARPQKPLWVRLAYGFIGFAHANGNCAVVGTGNPNTCFGPKYNTLSNDRNGDGVADQSAKAQFGHEISLRADYDIWTGFKVQTMVGVLIPTQGVPATEYDIQLLYNF
jgi:hypothetical protein